MNASKLSRLVSQLFWLKIIFKKMLCFMADIAWFIRWICWNAEKPKLQLAQAAKNLLWHWSDQGQKNNMKAWICPAFYKPAAGSVMAWGTFSWHTLGPSVTTDCCLDTLMTSTPLCDHDEPSPDGEQRNMTPSRNRLKLLPWTWQWFHLCRII